MDDKEYYWTEMWYNKNLDKEEVEDIYSDMEWWYEYQMQDYDE